MLAHNCRAICYTTDSPLCMLCAETQLKNLKNGPCLWIRDSCVQSSPISVIVVAPARVSTMVKSGTISPKSELSDFTSETRDVVLSYFSLLPVQGRDGNLGGSLTSNSTNSSTTHTFKGDLLITGRHGKDPTSLPSKELAHSHKDVLPRHEKISKSKVVCQSKGTDPLEIDYVDSGRRHRKAKPAPEKRFARSVSYDPNNARIQSQSLPESMGNKKLGSKCLLSEPKPLPSRARSVSPARPTTLNVVPVYPPTTLDNYNIIDNQWGGGRQRKYDFKTGRIDCFEKRDFSKEDVKRKRNFESLHTGKSLSGYDKQLSKKAQSDQHLPSTKKSGKSSLQNSQSNSIDRSSLNSDASMTSKTLSSGNTESVVSVLDFEDDEVQKLVDNSIVSPVALPLKHAIEDSLVEDQTEEAISRSPARSRPSDFNKRLSNSLNSKISRSPGARCATPQTEVAQLIAAIGDQIQQEYGHILNQAISSAVALPEDRLDPHTLEEIISREGIINRERGWKKAVMVLTFCKGLALALISNNRSISRLLDSTVEMVADSFAHFVIRQGGWTGILSSDVTPVSLLTPVSSPRDEDVKFPLDWDDIVEPGSGQHQLDGSYTENNDDQLGASGGFLDNSPYRHEHARPVDGTGSPSSAGRKDSDSMDDKDLERVRMEIWLMRQISEQYNEESYHRQKWSLFSTAAWTVVSLTVLGGVIVLVMKRRERLSTLFSFMKK